MKPFIKWPGGKTSVLKHLLPLVPRTFQMYYEPFLGGGALYFRLAQLRQEGEMHFGHAFLSDVNANLIEVYLTVRGDVDGLLQILRKMDQAYQKKVALCLQEAKDMYLQIRSKNPSTPLDRAARFIFLNKTCFNGLYRENSKGGFNVPFGKYKTPNIYNPKLFRSAHQLLLDDFLIVSDYTVAGAAKQGDFVYLDPPYFPIKQCSFTQYGSGQWTVQQHAQLSEFFRALNTRKVDLVLSNSDTPEVRELYKNLSVIEIRQNRSIGAKGRVSQRDLLILSDSLAERMGDENVRYQSSGSGATS